MRLLALGGHGWTGKAGLGDNGERGAAQV